MKKSISKKKQSISKKSNQTLHPATYNFVAHHFKTNPRAVLSLLYPERAELFHNASETTINLWAELSNMQLKALSVFKYGVPKELKRKVNKINNEIGTVLFEWFDEEEKQILENRVPSSVAAYLASINAFNSALDNAESALKRLLICLAEIVIDPIVGGTGGRSCGPEQGNWNVAWNRLELAARDVAINCAGYRP